jgi:hypothetical protein
MIIGAPTLLLDVAASHIRDRRREARAAADRHVVRSLRARAARRG